MHKKVAVIILNYERWQETVLCANSIMKGTEQGSHIIIVDNASGDDSSIKLHQWVLTQGKGEAPHRITSASVPDLDWGESVTNGSLRISFLRMQRNGGYAYGNNAGICLALEHGADAFWILNNDTIVDKNALGAMRRRLFADDSPGLCGSLLLYADVKDCVQCCGGGRTNIWTFLSRLRGRNLTREEALALDAKDVERSLNFIYGASMMASRQFYEAVGPLDESLFLYCEEQDWAWRGMKKGFTLAYTPLAVVWHREGYTSGMSYRRKDMKSQWRLLVSRIRVTLKHHPYALPFVILGCCYAGVRLFVKRIFAASC